MPGNSSNSTPEVNLCYSLELYDQTQPLADASLTTLKATIAINSIMAPVVFSINLMVMWAILEDENLRSVLHNLLIAWLALTDLLIGVISQPLNIAVLTYAHLENTVPCTLKMLYGTIAKLLTTWSMITLSALNIERYVAIQHPYFHIDPGNRRKIIIGAVILWLFMPIIILNNHFTSSKLMICRLIFSILFSSSFIIIAFCTVKVQITAYRHRLFLAQQVAAAANAQSEEYRRIQRKELRRCFAMLISVVLYFAFNAPIFSVTAINTARKWRVKEKMVSFPTTVTITLLYVQALANPILFIICLSYVREGVKKKVSDLLRFFTCKTNAQVHPTDEGDNNDEV